MFKIGSFEAELQQSMEQNLGSMAVENTYGFSKLAKAVGYLSEAAAIFKKAEMDSEAIELYNIVKKFAEYELSNVPADPNAYDSNHPPVATKNETWKGQLVKVNPQNNKKFIVNPLSFKMEYLPENNVSNKNKFGLSNEDVERVQLSLNKVIKNYQGTKPQPLIPDQKWGPATEAAFNWYDKNTHNSALQSLKALLDNTSKQETAGGMRG